MNVRNAHKALPAVCKSGPQVLKDSRGGARVLRFEASMPGA